MREWHSPLSKSEPVYGSAISRRGAIVAACAFAAFAMLSPGPARAADPANAIEAFVRQAIDKGYAILNNKTLSDQERHAQFRTFILSLTDTRRVGLFTLGPYANGAPKADLDNFLTAFTDYAVAVYDSRLGKYTGETLKITGSVPRSADDVVVNADVISPTDPTVYKASFRVRKASDGRLIVTDIEVEGIWLALSQRSDFTGFLQQHNGDLKALTADLKRQTEMLYSGGPPQSAAR